MNCPITSAESATRCLEWFKKDLSYNQEHDLWASLTPIYERIITRASELGDFFEDIDGQLDYVQRKLFLEILLDVDMFWSSQCAEHIRKQYNFLLDSNEQIAKAFRHLETLLQDRADFTQERRWYSYVDTGVADVLFTAGKQYPLFRSRVSDKFLSLMSYDDKYWPPFTELLNELGNRFQEAEIEPSDESLWLLLDQKRASSLDVLILFFTEIQNRKRGTRLNKNFRLRDSSVASAINIAMDMPPEALFTAEKVKVGRQNLRNKGWDVWGEPYRSQEYSDY
ncbi:MAG TPA: hypothetical protein DCS35_08230 [Vibrio sp.]|nr:hypothetical protein [Vibrio sp.]